MFKRIRVLILLGVLVNVAVGAWLLRVRTAAWDRPLRVAVFTIPADGSAGTRRYIGELDRSSFEPLESFFASEARRLGLALARPVEVRPAGRLDSLPPPPPFGGSRVDILLWSLHLRWWVWQHGDPAGPAPHARLFLLFHDPAIDTAVPHSVGLPQGLIGVVHLFAAHEQAGQNAVVAAHELLHTLGASDKYDAADNQPLHPDGYAEPDRVPLLPQRFAEIMGGRIPLSATQSAMPDSLDEVRVGNVTAREIGWTR